MYKATYRIPGEKRPRTVSGRTKAEAALRRAERLAEIEAAGRPLRHDSTTTVAAFSGWWLDHVASHRVRASTLAKYRERLSDERLGSLAQVPIPELRSEDVAGWQSALLDRGLAPSTVSDARSTLRQVIASAVDHDLIATNPVDRTRPPRTAHEPGRALAAEEVRALIAAADHYRYGAAVALLFVQGWRVSEVLGLAWEDLDLDAGTAALRRAAVDVAGASRRLGLPKSAGAQGLHMLAAGVVERLRRRKDVQDDERAHAQDGWITHTYDGQQISLVFTKADGGIVARQQIDKLIRRAAEDAGISDTQRLGTHAGRRSVVTGLYVDGVELADIARHVGHSSPSTTAGYVGDCQIVGVTDLAVHCCWGS